MPYSPKSFYHSKFNESERRRMKNLTSKETEYVDKLLSERKRADARFRGDDMLSAVKAASICGYQEGIDYAMKTFFSIYLGGEE